MTFTPEMTTNLSAMLNNAHVKTRKQSGRSLSYVEGWHAIAEANRIFGFDGWTRETIDIRCVTEGPVTLTSGAGFSVSYTARVRITVHGVLRDGVGAGHGKDRDLGLAHESAIKEAETDAMKRALMTFGNPFGLALYDKDQANVDHSPLPPATSHALEAARSVMSAQYTRVDLRNWIEATRNGVKNGNAPITEGEFAALFEEAKALASRLPETKDAA